MQNIIWFDFFLTEKINLWQKVRECFSLEMLDIYEVYGVPLLDMKEQNFRQNGFHFFDITTWIKAELKGISMLDFYTQDNEMG